MAKHMLKEAGSYLQSDHMLLPLRSMVTIALLGASGAKRSAG
jgi:hypothetical protein